MNRISFSKKWKIGSCQLEWDLFTGSIQMERIFQAFGIFFYYTKWLIFRWYFLILWMWLQCWDTKRWLGHWPATVELIWTFTRGTIFPRFWANKAKPTIKSDSKSHQLTQRVTHKSLYCWGNVGHHPFIANTSNINSMQVENFLFTYVSCLPFLQLRMHHL